MSGATPFFSIVVPVRDGGEAFAHCLRSVAASGFAERELIVVDDGSRDGSLAHAERSGARCLATEAEGSGPAAARNVGAQEAHGEFVLFLDADCELLPGSLERAARILRSDPELDAVFGSYDDRPAAAGTVSQFRNLLHHYVHHRHAGPAVTFWAGCGAVRRRAFEEVGGFDAARYAEPSIEDIELGYRLSRSGRRIVCAPEVAVRHHKRWTLASMVRTDLLRRGVPWAELVLESGHGGRELNLDATHRAGVVLLGLGAAAGALGLALAEPAWGASAAALLALLLALNLRTYRFFARARGVAFLLAAVPLHLLFLAVCGLSAALGAGRFLAGRMKERPS